MEIQTQLDSQNILGDQLQLTDNDIAQFCQHWNITELALFGSVLRDDFHAESDINILITYAPNHHLRWRDWIAAKTELEQLFQRNVDLVEKALLKNPYRRAEILKTAWIVYPHE